MAPSAPKPTDTTGLATRSVHGDHDYIIGPAVAPDISVTTTFRHPSPEEIASKPEGHYTTNWDPSNPSRDLYARYTQPTLTRAEKVLTSLIGQPTIAYPSGLAAAFQLLLHVRPNVIAIMTGKGYHGCHQSILVYRQTRGEENVQLIDLDDEYPKDKKLLVWLETPLNPTGEVLSIEAYSKKAHEAGGVIAVDSTFAPPPIQDPFRWGADYRIDSGTKYFGGASDLLSGTIAVKDPLAWKALWFNRTYTGSNPGSLESWLLLRSLRTLSLRVTRQSTTATALAQWLASLTRASPGSKLDGPSDVVEHVWHATLQEDGGEESRKLVGKGRQMEMGSACFGLLMKKKEYATQIGHQLELFTPATSLGGVESLIEQRSISDPGADPRLIRLSIGLEDFEDLKADLIRGFEKVVAIDEGRVAKL